MRHFPVSGSSADQVIKTLGDQNFIVGCERHHGESRENAPRTHECHLVMFLAPCWILCADVRQKEEMREPSCEGFANSLDPDETPQNVASHLDPNCLLF
ncbi:hypothetical protein DPMN_132906 [Dreissena polymorpha]|uniref:Uncharacterized protein n=1 Tax=Dreissena polymorpha TaxID=45954 RepID=A0A9D4FZ58_DREPO|nr:hypothetical protein DPMN_132906 [Dreissena polymorpha]